MSRLYNLDYLRGVAAFGIMIYHYLSWTFGKYESDTFMGRLGIYGVSIFYVLSGLTLYFVYYTKMKPNKVQLKDFYKKRIFRIFPLLWLVTIVSIILSRQIPNWWDLFLNLTGLFGFINWDKYFSTGVWSIGNELVFYAFFPFFILFAKKSKVLFLLFSGLIFSLFIYFSFFKLSTSIQLTDQWRDYINPLNQVFLFLSGFLIGYIFQEIKINNTISILMMIGAFVLFILYPIEGDSVNLVTGSNRVILTVCCIIICLSFYKLSIQLPNLIHKPLTFLGESSYSVYLIHPIVYSVVGFLSNSFFSFSSHTKLILSILTTLILSYFTYEYFEKYFMKLGRKK